MQIMLEMLWYPMMGVMGLMFSIALCLVLALPLAYHYDDKKTAREIVGILGKVLIALVGVVSTLAKLIEWLKSDSEE